MKKLKIGITGSTGSLGKAIIHSNKNLKFIPYKGDIRSKLKLKEWFQNNKLDCVLHLAAVVPIKEVNRNKKKAMDVNYFGTKNLVDLALKNKISWFFFASTSHVYFSSKKKINENFKLRPISFYGKTKLLGEKYIIKKFTKTKTSFCIGRIFSTTNKNQKKNYLVPDLKTRIKNSKNKIILKNLNHYRDFISLEDLSKIIMSLYKKKFKGVINLGSGKDTHLKNIAIIIAKKYKKKIIFDDNKKPTYLVSNISKLKKNYKLKLSKRIEKHIF